MTEQEAMERLRKGGYKLTARRLDMLRFFATDNKYKTAKQLYAYMTAKYPSISFDTVYRNLHLYFQLGILERTNLNAEQHYRIACGQHHHHFICKLCGMTKKLNFCPMDYVTELLSPFRVDDHKFEVYGICNQCH